MNQQKKEQLFKDIINLQLSYVGLKFDDVIGVHNWFAQHTLTQEQFEEWQDKSLQLLRKSGFSKLAAQKEFAWLNLGYGLRVIENNTCTDEIN